MSQFLGDLTCVFVPVSSNSAGPEIRERAFMKLLPCERSFAYVIPSKPQNSLGGGSSCSAFTQGETEAQRGISSRMENESTLKSIYYVPHATGFTEINSFDTPSPKSAGEQTLVPASLSTEGKCRARSFKELTQTYTASKWQSKISDQGLLGLESVP